MSTGEAERLFSGFASSSGAGASEAGTRQGRERLIQRTDKGKTNACYLPCLCVVKANELSSMNPAKECPTGNGNKLSSSVRQYNQLLLTLSTAKLNECWA